MKHPKIQNLARGAEGGLEGGLVHQAGHHDMQCHVCMLPKMCDSAIPCVHIRAFWDVHWQKEFESVLINLWEFASQLD